MQAMLATNKYSFKTGTVKIKKVNHTIHAFKPSQLLTPLLCENTFKLMNKY